MNFKRQRGDIGLNVLFCDRGRHQGGNAGAPGGDGSWWSEKSREKK